MGIDLGRKHDSTAIVIAESDDEGTVRIILVHELKDLPFAEQIAHIKRLAERYEPSSIHVDSTGLGLPVVEELHRQLGAIIEPVSFTTQSKAELVHKAVVLLQDRKLRLPSHPRLRDEMHSVVRQVTKDGTLLYRVSQKFGYAGAEYHHADLAWALMLAIRGIHEGGEITAIFTDGDRNVIDIEHPEKYLSETDKMMSKIARGFVPPPTFGTEVTPAGGSQWPIGTAWGTLISREWVYLGPTDQAPPVLLESLKDADPDRYAGLKAELKSRGLIKE